MPLPLAHPAAVLPLSFRRIPCLHFPSLVVGSLIPDAAYVIGGLGSVAHHTSGLWLFCLPAGLVAVVVMWLIGPSIVSFLPGILREDLEIFVRPPRSLPRVSSMARYRWLAGCLAIAAVSIVIGAATHLAWDSATHRDGTIVEHFPFLRQRIIPGHRSPRVCHLLWYGSTFLGVASLALAYGHWRRRRAIDPSLPLPTVGWRDVMVALFFGALTMPIALLHHMIRGLLGDAVVALLFALFIGTAMVWYRRKAAQPAAMSMRSIA